ncbi:neuraminidase-like domain-containing protein [Pseudomonas sp. zfem004]|uniref:Tc toxin subunit A-related protein n=1 Tax=Pseudomonas sp. zfem004 TaxID=3078199 RepID=UPI002929F2E0|nr:neuraminidase-like domain-containing protein [Pseudomonas sp. zfem004]MDU9402768.1 neuraminidase-like domain-containing protein [Pseudomonas sp. zfem004]
MNDNSSQSDYQAHATRTDSATYMSLFADDQTRCAPGALMANNNRLAYLVHLKELIQAFEVRADVAAPITLQKRRPDLLALKLEEKNTRKSLPKVKLVLNLLESRAQEALSTQQTLQQAVCEGIYQGNVPFHHAWESIKATLTARNLDLGEMLRRSNLGYPAFAFDNLANAEQRLATRLDCGFSPQLQALLLEGESTDAVFYKLHFQSEASKPLDLLNTSRALTKALGLTRRELRKLLAVNAIGKDGTSVRRSVNATAKSLAAPSSQVHGAAFINNAGKPLYLTELNATGNDKKTVEITGLARPHLDRLQRILRLQRALALSADETDALVMAALRAEGQSSNYRLTSNTLRALGLFRHLQQKFGVTPWQYAAFLDQVSPYATDQKESFYDKLFIPSNRDEEAPRAPALLLDDGEFDPNASSGDDALTIEQLCQALKVDVILLRVTLEWVTTAQGLRKPKRSLEVISACYRIITLSRLFGTSPLQGLTLLGLLMDEQPAYRQQLAGKPSLLGETNQPDLVDVLIGMMDAMAWLQKQGLDAVQLAMTLRQRVPLTSTLWERAFTTDTPTADNPETLHLALSRALGLEDSNLIEPLLKWAVIDSKSFSTRLDTIRRECTSGKTALSQFTDDDKQTWSILQRHSNMVNLFKLSADALKQITVNPGWLDLEGADKNHHRALDLTTVYQLGRYKAVLARLGAGKLEQDLLKYFADVNSNINAPLKEDSKTTWAALELLLGQPNGGLADLAAITPPTTLRGLDQLQRLLEIAGGQQLSVNSLLELSKLRQATDYTTFQQAAVVLRRACTSKQRKALDAQLSLAWRDALMHWMLAYWASKDAARSWVNSPQTLADYLLIDLQVSHEPLTTRVLSAIASLQRYLHQIHSCLENGYRNTAISEAERDEWENFSSSYERWKLRKDAQNEPQNYIDPTRRQRKTTAFKDLEMLLAQGKCQPEDVQTAMLAYLSTFEKLSNIQPISAYADGTSPLTDTYHFIGKTNVEPVEYYWRTLDMSQRDQDNAPSMLAWGEWEKISLSVGGQVALTPLPKTAPQSAEAGPAPATAASVEKAKMAQQVGPSKPQEQRTHVELIRPVVIVGRRYVLWVERETTALAMGPDNKPSEFFPLRVCFAFQQTDGAWSPPNELMRLDGHDANGLFQASQNAPEAVRGTAKGNPFLKTKDYMPGLMVMVNIKGDRLHDPWLTVLLFDANLQPAEASSPQRNVDYFISMRDLLLIENKELDVEDKTTRPIEGQLVNNWLAFFKDPRVVQHPYTGAVIELEEKTSDAVEFTWDDAVISERLANAYDTTSKGQVYLDASLADGLGDIEISVDMDALWKARDTGWVMKDYSVSDPRVGDIALVRFEATEIQEADLDYLSGKLLQKDTIRKYREIDTSSQYGTEGTYDINKVMSTFDKSINSIDIPDGENQKQFICNNFLRSTLTIIEKPKHTIQYNLRISTANKDDTNASTNETGETTISTTTAYILTKISTHHLKCLIHDFTTRESDPPENTTANKIELPHFKNGTPKKLEFTLQNYYPEKIEFSWEPEILQSQVTDSLYIPYRITASFSATRNATWTLPIAERSRLETPPLKQLETLLKEKPSAFKKLKQTLLKVRYITRETFNQKMNVTGSPSDASCLSITAAISNANQQGKADVVSALINDEKAALKRYFAADEQLPDDLLDAVLRLYHFTPDICRRILLYIDPQHLMTFEDVIQPNGKSQAKFLCPLNRDVTQITLKLTLLNPLNDTEVIGTATRAYTLRDLGDDAVPSVTLRRNDEQVIYLDLKEANDKLATNLPRMPDSLRINTLFGKQLVALATQSVQKTLSWEAQHLREPHLEPGSKPSTVDFRGANGLYFWELFFHVPFLVAWLQRQNREYSQAWRWCTRHLFDPYRNWTPEGNHPPLFWLTRPLLGRAAFAAPGEANDPDLLAYAEPERYRKALHLFVVESWQRQGDDRYRLLTLDSLIDAALCYDKALRLIGVLPENLSTAPLQAPSLDDARTDSFTPPLNNKLVELRNLLRNRQFNLRHGLSLDGKPASIMIAPEFLDQVAMGYGGSSQDSASPAYGSRKIPPCRYDKVRQCAGEAVQQLIAMGQTLRGLYDTEASQQLALLGKRNFIELLDFPKQLQEQALELARRERDTVLESQKLIRQRLSYYQELLDVGVKPLEETAQKLAGQSVTLRAVAVPYYFATSVAALAPTIFGTSWGGFSAEEMPEALANAYESIAETLETKSNQFDKQAEYQLRAKQWQYEVEQSTYELKVLDKQLLERDVHIRAARIAVQEARGTQAAHRAELELMTSVFASHHTYLWLIGRMSELYSAAYDATLSLCLMAEACLQYELGNFNDTWIKTNGWLDNWRGMLAGEALQRDLIQMDVAALRDSVRPLDIRKDLKLTKLKGWTKQQLLDALVKNEIFFELAPWHFDEDFPGHYLRRIERIMVTFDITGVPPSTAIPAMLYQTSNQVLLSDDLDGAKHMYLATQGNPAAVLRDVRPNQHVAIWSAKEVTRSFELQPSISDKTRYQPFEGTGVISSWKLQFPGGAINNPALYQAPAWMLNDINIQITYSAVEGSPSFRADIKNLFDNRQSSKQDNSEAVEADKLGNTDNALVTAKEAEQAAIAAFAKAQAAVNEPVLQIPEAAAQALKANEAKDTADKAAKAATAARLATETAAKAGKVDVANTEAQKALEAAENAIAAAKAADDALVAAKGAANKRKAEAAATAARTAEQQAVKALDAAIADADAPVLKAPWAKDWASKASDAVTNARTAVAEANTAAQNAQAAALSADADSAAIESDKAVEAAERAKTAAKIAADARTQAETQARQSVTFFGLLQTISASRTYAEVTTLLATIASKKAAARDEKVINALRNAQVYALVWGVYLADKADADTAAIAVKTDAAAADAKTAVTDARAAEDAYYEAKLTNADIQWVAEAIKVYESTKVKQERLAATVKVYINKALCLSRVSLGENYTHTGTIKNFNEQERTFELEDTVENFTYLIDFSKLTSVNAPPARLNVLSLDWEDIYLWH